ncbi:MAG: hypothetical protein GEU75_15695 [Dehalococcoidia bacterium]|nr:hypothetical protein [Dehalococcoidia bacterium]
MDEEVVLLEEQLASAHADIERLQSHLSEAEAQAASRDAELTEARRGLEAAQGELAARTVDLESLRTLAGETRAQAIAAAQRYRDTVLAHEPHLPADLVGGETIDAVDESLARARQTVAQVRQHLEQQAQSLRVPAGAPVRAGPDLSSLSAAEKIRLGLQQS